MGKYHQIQTPRILVTKSFCQILYRLQSTTIIVSASIYNYNSMVVPPKKYVFFLKNCSPLLGQMIQFLYALLIHHPRPWWSTLEIAGFSLRNSWFLASQFITHHLATKSGAKFARKKEMLSWKVNGELYYTHDGFPWDDYMFT